MLESSSASAPANLGGSQTSTLPDHPLVLIQPSRRNLSVNLGELWAYRELLFFLAWRDVKVRYKQTLLGVVWVVAQPLLMTLVFTVILGKLARVPTDGIPYPLMIYAALLPWTFFSSAVTNSGNSIVANAHLITKVYFPRLLIPASAIAARLIDLGVSFLLLIGLMIYYGVMVNVKVLALPLLLVLLIMLTLGIGVLIAALNVKYRDIGMMLPIFVQLWLFVSPILYPLSLVPERWRIFYILNPIVGIVTGFRASILGEPFNWTAIAVSVLFTVLIVMVGIVLFRRVEKEFADVV
jgi:lipopolysaccharide transport system permease protein